MEWTKSVINFLSSPKLLVGLLIASGLSLYCPACMFPSIKFIEFRSQHEPWFVMVFLTLIGMTITHFSYWIIFSVRKNSKKEIIRKLHNLSISEKQLLREFLEQYPEPLDIEYENNAAPRLAEFKILISSVATKHGGHLYDLAPWVCKYLKNRMKLLGNKK